MKLIITEAQYKKLLIEQNKSQPTSYTWSSPNMSTTSQENVTIVNEYPCIKNLDISSAVSVAIKNHKIPAIFVKTGLGIIGRESNFGKLTGEGGWKQLLPSRYALKAVPEYIMNSLDDDSSIKKIIEWGNKAILSKFKKLETKDLTMGLAQITPSVAKKYGVSVDNLMQYAGALVASSSYLQDIYNSLTNFDDNKPSVISSGNTTINNPNSTGNARLDATIISYNLGSSPLKTNYCMSTDATKTNKGIRVNCQDTTADKKTYIKNYLPNFITKTNVGNLSSHGYLKEVKEKSNIFTCVK
jgi:hypothetical protein